MKFDIKTIIIVALVAVIVYLLFPRMSFADEMASPAPSPSMNAKCLPQLFPISDLCPKDHPHTGDITPDGQKYCCE
jgi:hypothetical protein